MAVLQEYFASHFELAEGGKVLKLRSSALFSPATPETWSFDLSGGAHDYTADTAIWTPTDVPDAETNLRASGRFGDGDAVPYFWAANVDAYAAGGLTRTTGNRLRLTHNNGTNTWLSTNGGEIIVIPLPSSVALEIEWTAVIGATALANANRMTCGIGRGLTNATVGAAGLKIAQVDIEITGSTTGTEIAALWGNAYSSNAIDSYIASNIFTRHYRVVLDGPQVSLYGGAVGASTATTLIHGRSNAAHGQRHNDAFFFMGLAAGSTANGLYAELGTPLGWTAQREPY